MNAAYEQLVQHLDEHEFRYMSDADRQAICVDLQGEVGAYRFIAVVDEEAELFQLFAYLPVRIPAGARPAVSEAIGRANYGFRVGRFEMDYDDGELRFQISHVLSAGMLSDDLILGSFATAIAMLDRYLPAVLSVVYGNELPKDAIRIVEQAESAHAEHGAE